MNLRPSNETTVNLQSPVMAKNDAIAAENRRRVEALGLFGVNIMSSPGSGKTTLLEALAARFQNGMVVIEGDLQTRRDAERIERAGCRAHQIETNGACHLDAIAVSKALDSLNLQRESHRFLIIENVGNLVCPSGYALGEHLRIGLLSIPEGDDKVLKYPSLFGRIDALVITKTDLLPHIDFDIERAAAECRSLNPSVEVFTLSAKTGQGLGEFCEYLSDRAVSAHGRHAHHSMTSVQ